jgi:hypothetical protein
MNDRPFGFDTLTIPAVLTADGDPHAAETVARELGFDAVRVPAILVPEGGAPPRGDYIKFGVMIQLNRASGDTAGTETKIPPAGRDLDPDPTRLPKPHHHAESGAKSRQPPRFEQTKDPVATGIRSWRGMLTRRLPARPPPE